MRGDREWHYALVGEALFFDWRNKGARLSELLTFARVRAPATCEAQGALTL